jgi:coenzyme F420-reducing hydrogenase beta subunit
MEGWTMILVRTENGEDYLKRAVEAGVLELRAAEEEPDALKVMDRLAQKQRERIDPFDPHAATRWPDAEALRFAQQEAAAAD